MAATTWEALALRVGPAPGYVYCHQGCCEHAVYVADARRVHPADPRRPLCLPAADLPGTPWSLRASGN